MNATKGCENAGQPEARAFHNKLYRAKVGRTQAGSPTMELQPVKPAAPNARSGRQVAAMVYEVAAELERLLDEAEHPWVVAPEGWRGRIVLELTPGADEEEASRLLKDLMARLGLS